jgi:hypothetical protein
MGVLGKIQRWQYRGGRAGWSARIANRLGSTIFAAGIADFERIVDQYPVFRLA